MSCNLLKCCNLHKLKILTSADEYNIVGFATGGFDLWVNSNLRKSVSGKKNLQTKKNNQPLDFGLVKRDQEIWLKRNKVESWKLTLYSSVLKSVDRRMPEHFRP